MNYNITPKWYQFNENILVLTRRRTTEPGAMPQPIR